MSHTKSEQSSIDPLTRNDTVASGVEMADGAKNSEQVSHVPQCKVKIKNIAARLRACGNIKVLI